MPIFPGQRAACAPVFGAVALIQSGTTSYPADEFMVVLEGEVTLEGEGFRDTYRKGDAFFVPKGFKGTWHQPVPMVKFYVIIA